MSKDQFGSFALDLAVLLKQVDSVVSLIVFFSKQQIYGELYVDRAQFQSTPRNGIRCQHKLLYR